MRGGRDGSPGLHKRGVFVYNVCESSPAFSALTSFIFSRTDLKFSL